MRPATRRPSNARRPSLARAREPRNLQARCYRDLVPHPAIHAGFWPAITRRQSPPSPLPRLLALDADECSLWLETAAPAKPPRPLLVGADESAPSARDPEARRHYWTGH